ncbi:hypothetical protein APSETT444_006717 [Aspergillus pseudonomiae]
MEAFWPHTSTSTSKLVNLGKYETLDTITDVREEENRGVSKESDFPAGWWVSKDVFELEKRAIFSKAPHFDDIPGFDRSQNSLFAIHTVTNGAGFVFVNLEASPRISPADTSLLDAFANRNRLDSQSIWVAGQTIKADFNWKIALSEQTTAIRYDLYCSKDVGSHSQVVAEKLSKLLEEKARELETEYQGYVRDTALA